MTLVAGVDASTQSCKVVVRDADTGELVRSGRAPHPDGTSVDPAAWWDALLAAVADAGGIEDVSAISVAGQQHGMVALDSSGQPVRDALLWNDVRSARAALDLTAELGASTWAQAVGSVPLTSYTVSKLRWLRDHEPANAARVSAVALPHDYLTWRLRGFGPGEAPLDELTTDRSEASGTAYWSPAANAYREDLLEHAFGARPVLPHVHGPGEAVGVTGTEIPGVPAGVVIGAGAADNAAAALSFDADEGDVLMSLGTSGTVFAVTDSPVADSSGVVSGFADASGRFLPLVSTFNAARVLAAACRLLGSEHDELSALALSAPPGSNGLVHLPYLEGERTPNYPDATGSLVGMTLRSTTRACLARAMIEGMLCGLADGLDALLTLGVPARRIILIGGGARNPAVQQIAAEIFGGEVIVPPPLEYVATGAARQAAWALRAAVPSWPLRLGPVITAQPQPQVRSAYAHARERAGYELTAPVLVPRGPVS